MVHVVARVEDPYGRNSESSEDNVPLAVGLFVEAEIMGRTAEDAFVLPRGALRQEQGQRGVYVVDGDSRLRFRPVEVLRLERETVVLGDGLQAGDRVNVSPLAAIVDGMRVRVAGDAPRALAASDAGAAGAPGADEERATR
jgi:multidrug efflux pump subunit AcrA (membrane-fusion protein)